MSKAGSGITILTAVLALAVLCFGPSLASAQDTATGVIQIKPCYECPTGTTGEDGSFTCPDADGDGAPDWVPCGTPAINLCSKGRTAVALLDYADLGISRTGSTITFEGASPIRCVGADPDHDVLAGGQPDDLVCHFYTRELTGLVNKVQRGRNQVKGCMTIVVDGQETVICDDVVIFQQGSCK